MSSLLTDWRVSLKATLATAFPAARILDGERPDKLTRDQMVICVFSPGITEWDRDANMAQPAMVIRIWVPFPRNQTQTPKDPAPVEEAAMGLAGALQPTLTQGVTGGFFKVAAIEADYQDNYGVEATLVAWTRSPMMVGG